MAKLFVVQETITFLGAGGAKIVEIDRFELTKYPRFQTVDGVEYYNLIFDSRQAAVDYMEELE